MMFENVYVHNLQLFYHVSWFDRATNQQYSSIGFVRVSRIRVVCVLYGRGMFSAPKDSEHLPEESASHPSLLCRDALIGS